MFFSSPWDRGRRRPAPPRGIDDGECGSTRAGAARRVLALASHQHGDVGAGLPEPARSPPGPALVALRRALVCLALGGWLDARACGRGRPWRGGRRPRLPAHLLILGSVIGGDVPGALRKGALLWCRLALLGILLAGARAWAAAGAALRAARGAGLGADAAFAGVAAAATLLLLAAGVW